MSPPSAALIAFGVILLVELPDKSPVATFVLSTRLPTTAGAGRRRHRVRRPGR